MKENMPPKVAHPLARLATRVFGTPLLIQPEKLEVILSAVGSRFVIDGYPVAVPELSVDSEPNGRESFAVTSDGIAVIDVAGSLVNRSSWLDAYSGMTSYAQIREEFDVAMASPEIRGVLLRMDSNGGECAGCFDLADAIFAERGTKPIWAAVDDAAFSAAYMIASAADKVFVSRTGGVGSIGVVATHVDASGWDERAGLKYTMLTAGAHKKDFNSHEPLSDGARRQLQAEIDRLYGLFVETVARNRGMPPDAVRATEARLYFGERAVAAGLADAVFPFDEVVTQMTASFRINRIAPQMQAPMGAGAVVEPFTEPEETQMNELEIIPAATAATPPSASAPPPVATPPPATAEEVMELCELAGFDLATVREIRSRNLTVAQVRQELLAKRADATAKGIASVVPPVTSHQTDHMERAAREMAAATGRTWQQHYAEQLMMNPAAYDHYLAANPAQTQPGR
jgi:signal peptide peptidase SppA